MPNQPKQQKIDELEEKARKAKAMFLTDYRGLSVNDIQELKRVLRESQSEIQVTKNTLLEIALEKTGTKLEEELEGPTATLFAYEDEVSPLKEVVNFAKQHNELPQLKLGILDKKVLKIEQLKQLSLLPTKQILLSQVVGGIKAPLNNLMYTLNYHTSSLINVLSNIKKRKEEN